VTGLAKNQGVRLTVYLEDVSYIPPGNATETPDGGTTNHPGEAPGENPNENPGENPEETPSVTPSGEPADKPETDGAVKPDGTIPKGEAHTPDQDTAESKRNAALWIAIGVVAIAAAGAGAFFVRKYKKPSLDE
jgi:hypothetical protein